MNGDISLEAGNQLELSGAHINSQEGEIGIKAEQVQIKNATASYLSYIASHTERDGTFSAKSKDQRDIFYESTAVATALSGNTITIESDSDININASHLVADKDLKLQASENINLTSAEERYEHQQYVNEEESGLLSSGGIGFTIGSQQLDVTDISKQTRQMSSELGSLEGDVTMSAGQRYLQKASDVMAVQGDIDIAAAKVDIESATEILTREHTTEFSQSGLSISITNPVISAVQTADQMVEAARETSDPRMKALAAAAIGLNAKNAYNSVMTGQMGPDANTADKVGGINLSISIGSSKSSSQRSETIKEVHSSKLMASGDINIKAVGDGQNSDITVKGSEVLAGESVRLDADDQLNLVAAENTSVLKSKNDSSSGSVGVSIGTDGLLFTAGMAKGKGKENGQDRSWTETTIKANDKVVLESGSDTELRGAIVTANQVTAKVGNNLNIQSLQDTSIYDAEQKNTGGSISVGYGKVGGSLNLSASDIESDYASVIEQSGIQAGDKGFQIEVEGNTNLDGAVIASTQGAIDKQRNSLNTGTLTQSDIKNEAEYEADAGAVSLAIGTQAGEPQLTGSGIG
ncbi:MAG TPA: hemagglutinin repeat-containing protein, partial [Methylotenera sp.]|nr:hemagglutinin repeat-containing protein [Methylotenera sp.]